MPSNGLRVRRLAGSLLWLAAVLAACSEHTTIPPEPPASVRRGDEAFRYQQYSTAIEAYRSYIDQTEQGAYTARVMYKTALAEYRLSHYQATLATLDELSQRYPKAHWMQVEALRGDAERALGNNLLALQDWEKAWKLANDKDRQKLRKRIVTTAQDLSDVDLAGARRIATDQGYAALLDRQIAARQPSEFSESTANANPEETLVAESAAPSAPPIVEEPTEPAEAVQPTEASAPRTVAPPAAVDVEPLPSQETPKWSPPQAAGPGPANVAIEKMGGTGQGQIGCLLPLSGPARDLGERALRAVRLVVAPDYSRLVVADTEGKPEVAVRKFEEVAHDPRVLAVIGPVRSDDAQAVAPRAEELQVPVLLLSAHDGLSGKFVLPVGVTRAEQIARLLDYAMAKLRLRRFGLLYPKDAADVAATFRTAVEQRGGTIVGALPYPPGAGSSVPEVATIRKWRDRDNLQAVFLPDTAAVAAKFVNFLQREMPDVMLLGVREWDSLAQQHGATNGILFADGFYAGSERPATRAFVKRFQDVYGQTPGVIEANAYDAATLAERALAKGATTPADTVQVLRSLGPISGAASDITLTSKGLQRTVYLLQVAGGHLEEIGAAPSYAPPATVNAEAAPPLAAAPAAEARGVPSHTTLSDAEPRGGPVAPAPTPVAPVAAPAAPDGSSAHVKVACLLPLTGPDQAYGKRALAGLRLAFADAPEQLVVHDTGGDPAGTADALSALQHDTEVVAVVGPLRSSEAEVAAPIAERLRLPLLLLSAREGLAGHYVLQVAMTRTQQVRLLVHHLVAALNLRRVGIAYPNDGYGSTFAEAFKREAASKGASVVGTHPYPPGSSNFASVVVDVRGWQQAGLDALFIPDAAPTATALAADVRTEMPSVVLLGSESWNDSKSLADAGSAIDGAVFADAFFADSPRPSTRQFVHQFVQQMGQEPTGFEAQAFDAGMALRRVIAGGATSRERVIAGLRALGTFEAAGELRAAAGGFERTVSLLRYHNGKVEEVLVGATES